MTLDDLKRLFTRQTLFKLDAVHAPKLMPILYALGLAGLVLWAIRHLFATFATGFGNGLWGLIEIAVFGFFFMLALRIACEALLVYFRRNEEAAEAAGRGRYSASLLDEVREAIRDLAEEDDADFAEADEYITPATDVPPRPADPPTPPPPATTTPTPPPATLEDVAPPKRRSPVKRTARRTPAPKG